MKLRLSAIALAFSIGLSSPGMAQEKISIGSSNWPSLQAMSSVLREISEKYFAADATVVNSTLPIILASMDKGEIDILPELWSPNHDSLINNYVKKKGTVKLASNTFEVINGVCTTKHMYDHYGVKSIYDLSKPDVAELFKTAGSAKPKLWIGPGSWSSSRTEIVRARDYGYGDLFELSTVEEALAIVDLEQAIRSDQPWVGVCYFPHPVFSRGDVVKLEEPAHDDAQWKVVQPDENANWLQMSSVQTAWEPVEISIAYATTLEAKSPKIVALLKQIKLEPAEVASWIDTVGDKKIDPAVFAKKWVERNDARILDWMRAYEK